MTRFLSIMILLLCFGCFVNHDIYSDAISDVIDFSQDGRSDLIDWVAIDNPFGEGVVVYYNDIVFLDINTTVYPISQNAYLLINKYSFQSDYYNDFSFEDIKPYLTD